MSLRSRSSYGRIDYRVSHEREFSQLLLKLCWLADVSATRSTRTMVASLPQGANWAAEDRRFRPMNSLAVTMGGNVRIGLEDNLHEDIGKERLATNSGLVERVARLAHAAERRLATPAEARTLIGLAPR